ncbi:FecR protein [Rosistilla ulvae]|uniref:FecR protein n=1 Tax=Rosistilla ulvae TaxID=1930277 RepID=A0A517LY02_9BACT|nr:FecR domain-containing protein [Rosistilla ulvae]QDS87500.1 FecR protein [Rosistilla ulvae]
MSLPQENDPFELPEIDPQTAQLVDLCLLGAGSEADWAQLDQLLQTDDRVLAYYAACAQLHASLQSMAMEPSDEVVAAPVGRVPAIVDRRRTRQSNLVLVAAVLLLLLFAAKQWNAVGPTARIAFSTAQDLEIDGVYAERTFTGPGKLRFSEGSIGLTLLANVDLVIEGPAELEIVASNQLRLLSGRLIADAHPNAVPISIETPFCKVNDHGGRFGLASIAGQPDSIAVFQGKMRVSQVRNSHLLQQGDAVSINAAGEVTPLTSIAAGLFPDELDIDGTSNTNGLIRYVDDNIIDNSDYGAYRVAEQPFSEDVPAFVDRNHQWNGIGREAIPLPLRGAEYVMTMDYDRHHGAKLQIDLALRKPAIVYVLYDENLAAPDWLRRDFTETGFQVGLDKGPYFDKRLQVDQLEHTDLGAGSGESVDGCHVVWQREVPQAGTIRLGGVGTRRSSAEKLDASEEKTNDFSMYGIVVTPL